MTAKVLNNRILKLAAAHALTPQLRAALVQAVSTLFSEADTEPAWALELSQEPVKPRDPMQADVPTQSPVLNAPRNISGTNMPGEQMPEVSGGAGGTLGRHLPPGRWSGAVREGSTAYHPENRNSGQEGFQSRPGGETETGTLTKLAKKPALTAAETLDRTKQPTDQNIPMDRNVPSTRNVGPERNGYRANRAYKAAPRRSVFLTRPR